MIRNIFIVIFSILLTLMGLMIALSPTTNADDPSLDHTSIRKLHFTYETVIDDLPDKINDLRIWIPIPSSNENQTISALTVNTTPHLDTQFTQDKTWHNRILYTNIKDASAIHNGTAKIQISFDIVRRETSQVKQTDTLPPNQILLQGSRFAPITQEVINRSRESTKITHSTQDAARAIYDRVLRDVDYDKSTTGWGKGSTPYVCASGKGNCTDFHSLFIAMAQAKHIPAFFEIGVSIPTDNKQGTLTGYHCWAWYQNNHKLWKPVDASEADKHPAETDYYFGTIDANRIAFTRGRDIILQPQPTSSNPVNFFIYPVVELNKTPLNKGVHTVFHFQNIP